MLLLIERGNKMVNKKEFSEEKVKVCLDCVGFDKKPNKKEVIKISERVAKQVTYISISDLMKTITLPNARTFIPAVFNSEKRPNQSWKSQQVFVLDIVSGLRIEEAIKLGIKLRLEPTFIYTTFSHTDKEHRFRMVFIMDEEIRDPRVRKDRKSTRLNSSHVAISYAVFCFKK